MLDKPTEVNDLLCSVMWRQWTAERQPFLTEQTSKQESW